jgi:nucleoside-diphosphate-sugar epimerase
LNTRKKILVTGATGFLGGHMVRALIARGHEVDFIARDKLKAQSLIELGAKFIFQDLSKTFTLDQYHAVYHCAALSSPWGDYKNFYNANVLATKNLIVAMKESCSGLLIHISSPSLYFDFKDQFNVIESDTVTSRFINHYIETKKISEQIVSNSSDNLKTIILRPRGIFGPRDNSLIPRIVNIAKRGFFPLANPNAIVDITYIDNLIDAMLLCLEAPSKAHGKIFNISNSETLSIKEVLDSLFQKLQLKVKIIQVPYPILEGYAFLQEFLATHITKNEPGLTRYSLGVLSKSLTLNINLAKQFLNYEPKISIEEGLARYVNYSKGNELCIS